jgi:TatD DNase family protein
MIIDTHTHLDNKAYKDDIDDVLENARQNGVNKFIIPGADINDLDQAIKLAQKDDDIFFAVGIHPYHIDQYENSNLEKNINHPKCIAVGECGLDYYRLPEDENEKKENIRLQKEIFIKQIELAIKHNKPLIVHIRDASDDSLEILKAYSNTNLKGVLHCFNADEQLLEISNNFYYGIGGVLTFKNAKKLPQVLKKIPIDRILVETDSPYLTPHPHRGKRNEPAYVSLVLDKIADILEEDVTKLQEKIKINTNNLFNNFLI